MTGTTVASTVFVLVMLLLVSGLRVRVASQGQVHPQAEPTFSSSPLWMTFSVG
jgi:hypothetical protein